MKSKTVFIAVAITLSLIIAGQGFYLYRQHLSLQTLSSNYATLQEDYRALEQRHTSLESEYNSLTSEYSTLRSEHETLVSEHNALIRDHASLQTKYGDLQTDYSMLQTKYNSLDRKYEKLFSDYQLLEEVFDKPLTYKQVPTIEALQRWLLYEDETNTIRYDEPDFVCGDFAVILAIHAKTKHWDMGVVAIWGYIKDTREDFAHALCAIITTEGLVYVEPQTDDVWWYGEHEEIESGIIYGFPDDLWVYVEDVGIILQY